MEDRAIRMVAAEARHQKIMKLERELAELRREDLVARGEDDDEVKAECRRLLADSRKIAAVTFYRDNMGCSLTEARSAVEAL